jgi:hypothetical protein
MADRNTLEKVESVSRIFAAVFIPVVLGVAGSIANQTLERSKVRDELLKQAVDVVFFKEKLPGESTSFEGRRARRTHWLEMYNSLADVKLSNEFIAIMMEQDTLASEQPLYRIGSPPAPTAKNENGPESTNEDELGHGWVAVGRLDSKRYSDVNFDVAPNAITHNWTIKRDNIIHARWSVSLRYNTRNLEDRQGYSSAGIGLLWGGECAKVIDSLVDGRFQTWAFIEIVHCPAVPKSDPALERRAMSAVPSVIR